MTSKRQRFLERKEVEGLKKLILGQQRDLQQATHEALQRCTTEEDLDRVAITIHVLFHGLEEKTDKVKEEEGLMAALQSVIKANDEILEQIKALP